MREWIQSLKNERWRELLLQQLDAANETEMYARHSALREAVDAATARDPMQSELAPRLEDCALLLRIGLCCEFPSKASWQRPGTTLLGFFWHLHHPSFAPVIEQHYAAADDAERRDALVICCCQQDPESFLTLARLLRSHGLPQSLYPRFFWELNRRHVERAKLLLPGLLIDASASGDLGSVMNFCNSALEKGHLTPADLTSATPQIEQQARQLLDELAPKQRDSGTSWRAAEEYQPQRTRLGVYLDLLGILPGADTTILERALGMRDPLLLQFAIVACIKRQIGPSSSALVRCAASHETRANLYRQLQRFERLELFPTEYCSFEAFAAACMTDWLLYPAELGYEPSTLELVAKICSESDGKEEIRCLWRVTPEEGDPFAAVSGPHTVTAEIGPLDSGEDTFSNFTAWHELTPEQHLHAITETLGNWRVSWCAFDSSA